MLIGLDYNLPPLGGRSLLVWQGQAENFIVSCCSAAQSYPFEVPMAKIPGHPQHLTPCLSVTLPPAVIFPFIHDFLGSSLLFRNLLSTFSGLPLPFRLQIPKFKEEQEKVRPVSWLISISVSFSDSSKVWVWPFTPLHTGTQLCAACWHSNFSYFYSCQRKCLYCSCNLYSWCSYQVFKFSIGCL